MTIDLFRDPNISASALLALMSTLLIVMIGMLGDSIATRLGKLNANAVLSVRPKDFIELETEPVAEEPLRFSANSTRVV
jgi:hypothetical protein